MFAGDFDDEAEVLAYVGEQPGAPAVENLRLTRETDDTWFIWEDGNDASGWYLFEDGSLEQLR